MRKGVLYALSSYILWGFLPIYMKALSGVGALEILSHRVVWSLTLLALALTFSRSWNWLPEVLHNRRIMLTFAATAL